MNEMTLPWHIEAAGLCMQSKDVQAYRVMIQGRTMIHTDALQGPPPILQLYYGRDCLYGDSAPEIIKQTIDQPVSRISDVVLLPHE